MSRKNLLRSLQNNLTNWWKQHAVEFYIIGAILGILILLTSGLWLSSLDTLNGKTKQILTDQGYIDIHLTGPAPFNCGQDDLTRVGFVANSVANKKVKGVVCGAPFKGHTIRIK